ncbi:MAG: hypothetical protein ABIR32_03960 [Ilumatobacteraceae bacterium]
MLGRLGWWRHVVVAVAIAACSGLALIGVIGGGLRDERFDAKQITVSPAGGEGVRIREVVDQDFGHNDRHGYERTIHNDFGAPTDVTASSPDANATVNIADSLGATRIRLGDPNTTYDGQHRYLLSYTLPDARLSSGLLALDIIDPGEKFETGRFEVIVSGFQLTNTKCGVGSYGDMGGCTLEQVGDDYHVVFEPLHAGDGVTIAGNIVGFTNPADSGLPPLPPRTPDHRLLLALLMWPIGIAGAIAVFTIAKLRGRNDVFAGGAVEAAYGRMPAPGGPGIAPVLSVTRVSDARLADLATIEFVPPKGLDPWHGNVLLNERISSDTVSAWFSALAASEAITLRDDDGKLVIGSGPRRDELDPTNDAIVDKFLSGRAELKLGTYDSRFASAWSMVMRQQAETIKATGWWKRRPPRAGSSDGLGNAKTIILFVFVFVFVLGGSVLSAVGGWFQSIPLALVFGLVLPSLVSYGIYARMLPARSATGSALALLTESFRRFLAASEGKHVEWAWKQGLLREYSAWAVALGAADAWGTALASANVPETERYVSNPLLVHTMARSFTSSHIAPSSSGSSSGGGFSGGGSVGGGGGGGSSGSW